MTDRSDFLMSEAFNIVQLEFSKRGIVLDLDEIRGQRREQEAVRKRRIACVVLREAAFTFSAIGIFTNRNHATVMHLVGSNKDNSEQKRKLMLGYYRRKVKELEAQA